MHEVRSIRDGNIKRFKNYVAELTKGIWCLHDLINDSSNTFSNKSFQFMEQVIRQININKYIQNN